MSHVAMGSRDVPTAEPISKRRRVIGASCAEPEIWMSAFLRKHGSDEESRDVLGLVRVVTRHALVGRANDCRLLRFDLIDRVEVRAHAWIDGSNFQKITFLNEADVDVIVEVDGSG